MKALHANTPARISVVRDKHLVPLLASHDTQTAQEQPWRGVLLEQHAVSRGEIPKHEHPDLCLHLQVAGTDDFEWWSEGRNAIERTRNGSMILIPPGTSDRLHWNGRSERVIVSIRHEQLEKLAQDASFATTPEFSVKWSLYDSALGNLMAEMGREAQGGWRLGSLYADLLSLGLQTQLLRKYAAAPPSFADAKGGMALPKLRRALEFVNANLANDVRLEAIAKEVELSPSHFAHEFRGSTGQTPYQYLLDQRMTRAKELLRDTAWPVQYVGAVVGYESPTNFVRAFRQRVGCTPAAWRAAS